MAGNGCGAISSSSALSDRVLLSRKFASDHTLTGGQTEVAGASSIVITNTGFQRQSPGDAMFQTIGVFSPVNLNGKYLALVTMGQNTSGEYYYFYSAPAIFPAPLPTFGTGSGQTPTIANGSGAASLAWASSNGTQTITQSGHFTYLSSAGKTITQVESYLVACATDLGSAANVGANGEGCDAILSNSQATLYNSVVENNSVYALQSTSVTLTNTVTANVLGTPTANYDLTGKYITLRIMITQSDSVVWYHHSAGVRWGGPAVVSNQTITLLPIVPVFKQPKFAMPSKIDVDSTGKVKLSGKDMGVSSVLVGGKIQRIDSNTDDNLEFDTTGLANGVHDLVMKGAFGTYTVQKAIQVGAPVVTKVSNISARTVNVAGGELSLSGVGLEGTTQITMNGQILEIVSKTDTKVTFKVPASTVASVNDIMIEGSFVPVIFKKAVSYNR
jgi:hypothetical protein